MSGDRLTAVETALAHAEAAIEDLSQEVRRQEGEMEAMRRDLRRLYGLLQRLEERLGEDGGEPFLP